MAFNHILKKLNHGGRLQEAIAKYGQPKEAWLDLSTGINPNGYRPEELSNDSFLRLPEDDDGLLSAAEGYYGATNFLLTPGSQWTIQMLPRLRRELHGIGRVLLPQRGYQEHHLAWAREGFQLTYYDSVPTQEMLEQCDVCVVINPNNPTGQTSDSKQLEDVTETLNQKDGWLVVDEAFIEASEASSLVPLTGQNGLITTRSMGKFFGLAGIRVGAVFAWRELLEVLEKTLGPWSIATPSRQIALQAFKDKAWQGQTRQRCREQAERLSCLLESHFEQKPQGTDLFKTVYLDNAPDVFEQLCNRAILVRLLDCQSGLRFGLPPVDTECWLQLEKALAELFPI